MDPQAGLFVARQPIFDRQLQVCAYELLFRSGMSEGFDGTEENLATAKVISAAFFSPERDDGLRGKPAFINFPQRLLEEDGGLLLPRHRTVVEVLETVEPNAAVMAACSRLRSEGHRIALDDVVETKTRHPLSQVAEIVKADLRGAGCAGLAKIASLYRGSHELLAEKVETKEEFREAVALGYTMFQGYFFARPETSATRQIPASKLNYLRILEEIHRPDFDLPALSRLIRIESSLSYKLMRFVNSVLFSPDARIDSVERAVAFIGENMMRRWLSVVALMDLTSDKPHELLVSSMIRARFAELLAPCAGLATHAGDLFLAGMFSHLDALLGRPLEEILDGLGLPDHLLECLLGTSPPNDRMAELWRLVLAYQTGNWAEAGQAADGVGISLAGLPPVFAAAVRWSDELTRQ